MTRPLHRNPHGMVHRILHRTLRRCLPAVLLSAALSAVLTAPGAARAETLGAFYTLVETNLYREGPFEGPRVLVQPRLAFTVLDQAMGPKGRIWYQIVYPSETETLAAEGWTPRAPHELLPNEREPAVVYSRVVDGTRASFDTLSVPVAKLELLNETRSSDIFPRIVWQKVRYEVERPRRYWALGGAGIFRPGKSAGFMSLVYGEMVTRNVDKQKLYRLLSGVVRIGDSPQDVRWALGAPLRTQEETIGDAERTTWEYPQLVVHFENSVVKQIK